MVGAVVLCGVVRLELRGEHLMDEIAYEVGVEAALLEFVLGD